jgi:protein-S-isoprenylcysteine O-methyltransferase Ste14
MVVLVPLLPLLISRRWDWWEAWVYAAICILGYVLSRPLAERRHPGLLAERAAILKQEDAKPWDKLLVPLWGLFFALIMLAAGLDERWDWSPAFGLEAKIPALLIVLGGNILGSYALIENRFFSGMARIQTERDHRVVSSGPYRWIRHPGYAGALLAYLATPVVLASWWAYAPTLLLAAVVIVRTRLEDAMLREELAGYSDYARRVRYRLAPGIW